MPLRILFLVCLAATSCRPRSQASETRGGAARTVSNEIMGVADNKQEMLAAIAKRSNWLSQITKKGTPASRESCPMMAIDPCSQVNIIIELGHPGTSNVGHSGISISDTGDENNSVFHHYFDYGPGDETGGPPSSAGFLSGYPGTQWWDHPSKFPEVTLTTEEIGLAEILKNIQTLADNYTVLRVPVCTTKKHAQSIISYWRGIYANLPTYRIPGHHCTSLVARSFEWSHPDLSIMGQAVLRTMDSWTTSPLAYTKRIFSPNPARSFYKHTCGANRNQQPRAVVIQSFDGLAPKKWPTDSTLP
jgi:hypothetical protein